MRQRFVVGLLALGLVAAAASPARADFNIATGLKWCPLRYTAPIGAGLEGAGTNTGAVPGQWYKGTGEQLYGNHWQTTSLDNYLGFFFTEQIGIGVSLDIGWANHTNDSLTGAGPGSYSTSYFQVGIAIGGKFYLNRPTKERVSPYLGVNLFKYFAAISTNDPGVTNDIAAAIASFQSPLGFDLFFGAEYFFTTSFSLGAEVLGLRFAHVQSDISPAPGAHFAVNENYFTLYTGITLNYRFLATASVHTYEEEEDRANPRPKRKKRPVPREGEEGTEGTAPPPSPESVD